MKQCDKRNSHVSSKLNLIYIKKVKRSRYRPGVAQRVGRGIALFFHDRGTRRGGWLVACRGRSLPPGKTRYPFYRRLGGSQGRSGLAENLVLTGIRSWTVQPVVSRYTDWATGPTSFGLTPFKFPTAPFHLTSPHYTSPHLTSLHCTFRRFSPQFYSLHFSPFIIAFLTFFLKILFLQGEDPNASAGSWFQF